MSLVTGSEPPRRPPSGVKLTYDDFVLFPDDGKRHELIDGEHYVTPSPNLKHQAISRNILTSIGSYSASTRLGESMRRHSTWCSASSMSWNRISCSLPSRDARF